jgi:hypothetical protein
VTATLLELQLVRYWRGEHVLCTTPRAIKLLLSALHAKGPPPPVIDIALLRCALPPHSSAGAPASAFAEKGGVESGGKSGGGGCGKGQGGAGRGMCGAAKGLTTVAVAGGAAHSPYYPPVVASQGASMGSHQCADLESSGGGLALMVS